MNTILRLVQPHMALLLGLVLALAAGGTWLLRDRLGSRARQVLFFGLAVWVGIVAQVTLLRDGLPVAICPACLTQWATERALTGRLGDETLLNVALFVPLGFLATLLWRHPGRVTALFGLLSVTVELLQALFGSGVSDVLDVIANTLGVFVGAWLAWAVWLVRDVVVTRRIDVREAVTFVAVPLAIIALAWVGSTWVATSRQAKVASELEGRFADTTLADYEGWAANDELEVVVFAMGSPWASDAFQDESVARVVFPSGFYLSQRCVVASWTPDGFSAERVDGPACARAAAAPPTVD